MNYDIPFTKYVLQNGLTLIVNEDHKTPTVTIHIVYHVGSKNEPKGRSGFAHLFEHLMFNGSQHFQRRLLQGDAADRRDQPERHHQH